MKNWLIRTMLKSKKFWYAIAAIVIPMIAKEMDVDPAQVQNIVYSIIALILGQGAADLGKYMKK